MWNLTGGEENKPVSLKDICSFGRMRCFKPYSAVVAALKDSKTLIVSGDEGEEVVTRKKAYVPASDLAQARMAASVYVKGFGDEEPSTQFEIEAFFARYGPVNAIRLRRTPENLFKGSVFAEFQTEELAKKFLELDPAPTWKGHELMVMPKKAYVTDKTKKIQSGEIEASHNRPKRFYEGKEIGGRGNNRGRGRDSRRSGDPDDWKKRRDEDQKGGFKDRRHQRGRGGHGRGRGGRGGRGGRDGRDGRDGRNGRDNGEERTERADNEYVLCKPVFQKTTTNESIALKPPSFSRATQLERPRLRQSSSLLMASVLAKMMTEASNLRRRSIPRPRRFRRMPLELRTCVDGTAFRVCPPTTTLNYPKGLKQHFQVF